MEAVEYADVLRNELRSWSLTRPRSLQQGVGISDTGICREQARRKIMAIPKTDSPSEYAAVVGQAIHEVVEAARFMFHPDMILGREVEVNLTAATLLLPGHPDEIDPIEPSVNDVKTVASNDELILVQRMGATPQQRYQRHLYYYGAYSAGLVPYEGLVRNIWLSRAADTETVLVDQEPFNMAVVHAADEWWSDVTYAVDHNEEAAKDPHWTWCRAYCPWFTGCRGGDNPAEMITDPTMIQEARLHMDAKASRKLAEGLEAASKRELSILKPADGDIRVYQAGNVRIRWSWINREDLTAHGYWRLETEEAT